MLIIGWLTLILSLGLGFEIARRVFLENCRLTLLFLSPALALVSLLFTGTYLRSWLSPVASVIGALVLAVLSLAALRKFTWKRGSGGHHDQHGLKYEWMSA